MIGSANQVRAQNWSTDARSIALGSGGTENVAGKMAQEEVQYRAIVIPLGLFQVLPDWSVFNPSSDEFDPVRAIEYASNPLHYIFGRETSSSSPQGMFVNDIVNAELNRDLNTYRGFQPATSIEAEGLASPSWGKTIRFRRDADGYFRRLCRRGPVLLRQDRREFRRAAGEPPRQPHRRYLPNTTFLVTDETTAQLALAITGGYRARLPLANRADARDGVYVAANYHYLLGFSYNDIAMDVRLIRMQLVSSRSSRQRSRLRSADCTRPAAGASRSISAWQSSKTMGGRVRRQRHRQPDHVGGCGGPILCAAEPGGRRRLRRDHVPGIHGTAPDRFPVDYSANVGYSSDSWSAVSQ